MPGSAMRSIDSPADPRLIDLSALDADDELDTISLLDLEPDWREAIPDRDLETARQLLRVRVVGLRARSWQPPVQESAAYGFLIAEGLLLRRLRVGGAVSVELLGPGDLVRPGSPESRDGMVPPVIKWRALSPLRLAFLD